MQSFVALQMCFSVTMQAVSGALLLVYTQARK